MVFKVHQFSLQGTESYLFVCNVNMTSNLLAMIHTPQLKVETKSRGTEDFLMKLLCCCNSSIEGLIAQHKGRLLLLLLKN